MKNYLNKIMLAALIVMASYTGQAAIATLSTEAGTTNSLIAGPGAISYLTISATSNATVHAFLWDAPGVTTTNLTKGYTNYSPSIYTNVTYYTNVMDTWVSNGLNFFGANAYITNSYFYLTNLATSTGANATNTYRRLGVWTVSSNSTLSIPLSIPLTFVNGVMWSNDQPAAVTIQYQPFK